MRQETFVWEKVVIPLMMKEILALRKASLLLRAGMNPE